MKFRWDPPCTPSELTHFRKRIGEEGIKKIFEISVKIQGEKVSEKEVVVETTVQEKNITFSTDVNLNLKIVSKCREIAKEEGIKLRRSYTREIPKLLQDLKFKNHPKNKKKRRS